MPASLPTDAPRTWCGDLYTLLAAAASPRGAGFSEDACVAITAAANREGLAVTSWIANVAVRVAPNQLTPPKGGPSTDPPHACQRSDHGQQAAIKLGPRHAGKLVAVVIEDTHFRSLARRGAASCQALPRHRPDRQALHPRDRHPAGLRPRMSWGRNVKHVPDLTSTHAVASHVRAGAGGRSLAGAIV
jgi:hypothetical protein